MAKPPDEFWVFGYGSLMWRPGFDYIYKTPALLDGFHRSLCVYSYVHRGTREIPGLVFGLDHGRSCRGIAFSVQQENWQKTVEYLQEREQVTAVYLESTQQISLDDNSSKTVNALTFLVDRNHEQYAGELSMDEQLTFINQGKGQSGICRDYVIAAANQLKELDVEDKNLQALAKTLEA